MTEALSRGYRRIKLHEVDLRCIRAARGAAPREIPLMLDINCAWDTEAEAVQFCEDVAPHNTAWVEEPIWPPEDIPAIAQHFLNRIMARSRVRARGFTEEALELLRAYHWPGNVRELKNVIERSVILSDNASLTAEDMRLLNLDRPTPLTGHSRNRAGDGPGEPSPDIDGGSPRDANSEADLWSAVLSQDVSLDEIEQRFIAATLDKLGWNKSATARQPSR